MVDFYKHDAGYYILNGAITKPFQAVMILTDEQEVLLKKGETEVFRAPISEITDKNGTPYLNYGQLVEAVKGFFVEATDGGGGGGIVDFVKSYPASPSEGDWVFIKKTNNFFYLDRFENGIWKNYGAWGGSFASDNFIIDGVSGAYSFSPSPGIEYPLVSPAFTDKKGVAVGHIDGINALVNNGILRSYEGDVESNTGWLSDSTVTKKAKVFEIFEASNTLDYFITRALIRIKDAPAGTRSRLYVTDNTGALLYESQSEFNFNNSPSLAIPIAAGASTPTYNFVPPVRYLKNITYNAFIQFNNEVTLSGATENGKFNPARFVYRKKALVKDIVRMWNWQDWRDIKGNFVKDQIIFEQEKLWRCTTSGSQVGGFSVNGGYWKPIYDRRFDGCKMSMNFDQMMTPNIWTKVPFNIIPYARGTSTSPGTSPIRIQITESGIYHVNGSAVLDGTQNTSTKALMICNAETATAPICASYNNYSASYMIVNCHTTTYLQAGTYITMWVIASDGCTIRANFNSGSVTWLAINKVDD